MTGISKDRLEQIAALADTLPDRYQEAAFSELLRHELGNKSPRKEPGGREQNGGDGDTVEETPGRNFPDWFIELVERMPDRDVFASSGRDAQAAWALVELHRRGEPVTVASARDLIKIELGETPERRQHMSNRLGEFTPRYANRLPHKGNAYRYEPTRRIVEMFPTAEGSD